MSVVDRIKEACTARGVAISRLERECGFSNGYIRGMKDGNMSAERLQKVATYLRVSFNWLLTGEQPNDGYYINAETAEMAQNLYDRKDLRMLFDSVRNLSKEQIKLLQQMADSWENKG